MFLPENKVAFLRGIYPSGTRILLHEMLEDPQPVEPGTKGTVVYVDDAGSIHMKWDNGRGLALIPGVDRFEVISHAK